MAMRAPATLAVAFPSHRFRDLTGALELSLARAVWSGLPRPVRVGRVLEVMFDRISGQAVTPERLRHLASSAREWLLQRAALRLWSDSGWFEARCRICERAFDLPVTLADAPRKAAGAGFPVIEVATSLGPRAFEAPNGAHEEALAETRFAAGPVRHLLGLCGLEAEALADATRFTPQDLGTIEAAFEAACPDVADHLNTRCPACASDIEVRIDPMGFAFPSSRAVLGDVHLIASAYHWSEADILAMPSPRRAAYADLIRSDRAGGRPR